MRNLKDFVVVITGASSGIGRAAAQGFARRGASVVLAARREQALKEAAEECESLGGRAVAVPTDVTKEEAVEALARRAIEAYGRVDVWVNNAAVTLFARIEEAPIEAHRRVIETNLFGYIYGARAALKIMREQGWGVLINNASIYGAAAAPYLSSYIASKFAIRGLSESLRMETADAPHIHVCTVLPASIDTPFFQHAANYTGRAVRPVRPVYDAARVAAAIVRLAKYPRREIVIGGAGRLGRALHGLSPAIYEATTRRLAERQHFQGRAVEPTQGNLFSPMERWTGVSGGWRPPRRSGALAGLAVAGTGLAALWWLRANGKKGGLGGMLWRLKAAMGGK